MQVMMTRSRQIFKYVIRKETEVISNFIQNCKSGLTSTCFKSRKVKFNQ